MRRTTADLVLLMVLVPLCGIVAQAQMPTYQVGRTPSAEEIRNWDLSSFTGNAVPVVSPDGKGLPPGAGTAQEGRRVWAQWCEQCHGADGRYEWPFRLHMPSQGKAPVLAGERGAVLQRQFATSLWDYINRAMPLRQGGTLRADEVYAVTAYLLYLNRIVQEGDVLDAQSLPRVQMPNRPKGYPVPGTR